jgi:hypothetical protein
MKLRESDLYFSIKRAASAKMAASAWPLRHGRFGGQWWRSTANRRIPKGGIAMLCLYNS